MDWFTQKSSRSVYYRDDLHTTWFFGTVTVPNGASSFRAVFTSIRLLFLRRHAHYSIPSPALSRFPVFLCISSSSQKGSLASVMWISMKCVIVIKLLILLLIKESIARYFITIDVFSVIRIVVYYWSNTNKDKLISLVIFLFLPVLEIYGVEMWRDLFLLVFGLWWFYWKLPYTFEDIKILNGFSVLSRLIYRSSLVSWHNQLFTPGRDKGC